MTREEALSRFPVKEPPLPQKVVLGGHVAKELGDDIVREKTTHVVCLPNSWQIKASSSSVSAPYLPERMPSPRLNGLAILAIRPTR